jgi:GH25 family lysozyme M1 (1,4-beta-N-acetylmuramidase)
MKKGIRIIVILALLLVLGGCKEKIHTKIPNDVILEFSKQEFEVYEEVSLENVIKGSNVEVINQTIDTNTIGEHSIDYYFTYHNKKYINHFIYKVVDTEAPKIFGGKNKTVLVNYKKDLCDLVTYGDNYDGNAVCKISGEYNLEKVGTYKIVIEVTDSSNNSTEHNINLSVVNNTESSSNNSVTKKLAFKDAYDKYKTEDNELGIDVSKWQGDIDFEKVKEAGATFVMIRLGVKLNSGEEPYVDSFFLQNIKNAKEAGLKVGVYLYSKALSKEEAISEAEWLLNTLGSESLDLPIVFDWEIWSGWNSYHLSFHDLNEMAKGFISKVEEKGYKGMLYGSKHYLENFWDDTYDNVWLAHYVTETSYQNYDIWQFSNVGRIPGINGDVDLDIMKK